ncbi:MAG: exopolysaccharide biosynthesis polyprenyl glycosylphosphotransferase [Candidatus Omnitrophica bacterium]|nr:exopolysaccharide biosynthesis polyprenyl glycosylphosphotransferase [Candidatus Omnitrophota bacterium]
MHSSKLAKQSRYFLLKRLFDITVSLPLLFLSLPLFLLIPLMIKLTSKGQVIFKQKRVGLNGKFFTMYKFRSMISNAEQLKSELELFNMLDGPAFKMKKDPRVTKFGRFLRKTSLDELPQLWNVVKGQMSIVGPRPLVASEIKDMAPKHFFRLKVKPGLTCLWQISGRSQIIDFERWLKLDLDYVNNCSLLLDIKILLKTVPVVLSGFGAE